MEKQTLKRYSKETAKELVKVFATIDVKEAKGEGTFEVVATTEDVDRDGEVIMVKGWDFTNFMKNPVVLFGHDYFSFPIGAVTDLSVQDDRVVVKGVFARTEEGQKARILYDDGILKTVSVGFIPKERNGNLITKAELLEISFVPVPSNPEALDTRKAVDSLETMLKSKVKIKKNVVAYKEYERAPQTQEWDEKAAVAKVKEWAAEDDGKAIDLTKFKEAFAWFDGTDDAEESSYKLPHHTIVGDRVTTVWRGVMSAMAGLLSEDGAGIPEDERKAVYSHLAKHYNEFEKEPPEFKSYSQYEIDTLFPTKKEEVSDGQKDQVKHLISTLKSDVNNLVTDAVERIETVIGKSDNDVQPISKAGRTLSSKTRNSINNAVEAMGKAGEALAKLLESTDSSENEDGKTADRELLKNLQGFDKAVEKAIKTVKERIK